MNSPLAQLTICAQLNDTRMVMTLVRLPCRQEQHILPPQGTLEASVEAFEIATLVTEFCALPVCKYVPISSNLVQCRRDYAFRSITKKRVEAEMAISGLLPTR